MTLPWPEHWQDIPEEDREAVSDILTRLLAHGALLGDDGRERQLYLLARNELAHKLVEYFAPLNLEVYFDPDDPIVQLRPGPGSSGLSSRFNKAETLVILTLWRIYHDVRMEQTVKGVFIAVKKLWENLKIYFANIVPPNETQLRQILGRLRDHRMVRMQRASDSDSFDETTIEILPTLHRAIPFDDPSAWEDQCALYRGANEEAGADRETEELS
ncbi:MAG: DUF4194 domain-containing protein [Opitutales bacterium]|nr:DUF4194 domain-containing protein [Opitutales bacterium]